MLHIPQHYVAMVTSNSIRSFRTSEGLTLEEFASRFGVHKSTALRWEENGVPAERVIAISRVTGIPARELRPDLYEAAS
jgi:transcriptional regulator with XRE-family HTH domain